MFDFLFGWRKASKCKNLIKQGRCRLKYLKNRKSLVVRQDREDIASLLMFGREAEAFNRVDQLCKDENLLAVYELLDNFCEFVQLNLSYICRNKDIPNDINEAISSLLFASSRCGDLPELLRLRILFTERYGQHFEETATQLLPGNLVNPQIKEKITLAGPKITDDLKQRLLDEMAKEYHVPPKILAIEYPSNLHQQVISAPETCQSDASSGVNNMDATRFLPSPSETLLPHVAEDMIIHLDDIEEVASYSNGKEDDDHFPDQRTFKFKASPQLKTDQVEGAIPIAKHSICSPIPGTKKVKPTRKRRRCRNPMMQGGSSRMEDEYSGYYHSPCRKYRDNRHHKDNPNHVAVMERQVVKKPPYVRAMTMPQVRLNDRGIDSVVRSKSFPLPVPTHVHPKLPDYDELAAKFRVYKRDYQQQKARGSILQEVAIGCGEAFTEVE